jgi:4'-phosphopantetheinyl transferase
MTPMDATPTLAWPEPAEFPALARSTIHLWCAWLDEPALTTPAASGLLAADERTRAASFRFAVDRDRYVAGRVILRRLLGRYLDVEPAGLRLTYGVYGKPQLAGAGAPPALQFNVSHCGPLALIGIARDNRLGVDLERLQELPELASLETQLLAHEALPPGASESDRRNHFFRYWTRLEATGKLWGSGLMYEAPAPDWIKPLDPAAGHVGCLAYDGDQARVESFTATADLLVCPAPNTVSSHPRLPGLPHRPAPVPSLYSNIYAPGCP